MVRISSPGLTEETGEARVTRQLTTHVDDHGRRGVVGSSLLVVRLDSEGVLGAWSKVIHPGVGLVDVGHLHQLAQGGRGSEIGHEVLAIRK